MAPSASTFGSLLAQLRASVLSPKKIAPPSSQPARRPISTSRPAAEILLADSRGARVSQRTRTSRVDAGIPNRKDAGEISKLVEELGYVPNFTARARGKHTNVLQVVLAAPMFHGHPGASLLSILNASSAGHHVSCPTRTGRMGSCAMTLPFDVDGVIILGQDPTIDVAIGSELPDSPRSDERKRARWHLDGRRRQCAQGALATSALLA